jgi:hypothetical protein
MAKGIQSKPPARIEHVRLPDDMPPQGTSDTYNVHGEPDADGTVIISSFGVQFIWARFQEPVKAGQIATMVVSNLNSQEVGGGGSRFLTGACVMDGAATEWDMSTNQPTFGDGVVELIAIERGVGVGRIVCRNTYDADLYIAAGVAAPISIPGPP